MRLPASAFCKAVTLEPYVGAITSVSNPDRNSSRLANVVFSVDQPEVTVTPRAEART